MKTREANWWCLPRWPGRWTQAALLASVTQATLAQDLQAQLAAADTGEPQQVVVSARSERRIGNSVAASEGAVGGQDLSVRPLLRTAELLEAIPGMIAVQHSGSGKANQYFLRGFNLDHGTDFSLLIDEVPMNFRTHGHGQGYLDVGSLIPELVTRIDYRKGPYRADAGDFSLVGMASVTTADYFDQAFGIAEAGSFGWRRAVAGGSWEVGHTDLLLAAEAKRYDGPWQLPEQLRHQSVYLKATHDTDIGTLRASLSIYRADWRPTEQIPERAIGSLIADEFSSIDPNLAGYTNRNILSLRLDSDRWRVSAHAQTYDWKLRSNFTFFLDDPVDGDEVQQVDHRRILGGRVERHFKPASDWRLWLGVEGRFDDIPTVGLYKSVGGVTVAPRGVFAVKERSAAAYAEAAWAPTDTVELFGGLRADRYRFDTRALEGADTWSGHVDDRLVSPKLGASWKPGDGIALYANWGRGFHSNDARGVTSPSSPAPGLVPGTGSELGARLEREGLVFAASLWQMQVSSDLIYVGDSGAVEPAGATRRKGYELSANWRPRPWLNVDASWTGSHARFVDAPGEDHVPGALESTGELGVAAIFDGWNAALRVRHLGPHALVEDNSVRSPGTTQLNLRAAWTPRRADGGRFELYGELLNVFDTRAKDVDYYYVSRLPGEPPEGVAGLHSRVVEPRSVRVGVRVSF